MERKEAAFKRQLEEQKALAEREEKHALQNIQKREILKSIKAEIEPLVIEANEIAASCGFDITF
jgi:hypothetical protein